MVRYLRKYILMYNIFQTIEFFFNESYFKIHLELKTLRYTA